MISEEDNGHNENTRQCSYSFISACKDDQNHQVAIDMLPGGILLDEQFILDDSIQEFLIHRHFSQLLECNLYRWRVIPSQLNPLEKIKVIEIPVKKIWPQGRNQFEDIIMRFRNGSSYAREIAEKMEIFQKFIRAQQASKMSLQKGARERNPS